MNGNHEREIWIDDVRVIACILVLSGHLMQSMTSSDIIPANVLYQWFNKTIYYFHVPLFFICSGYLYQMHSTINNVGDWLKNVLKKLITLGIPYFTFTILTWLIKMLSGGAGNNEIDNIFETLFIHPTAPFWYLYTLFFCFLITVTFSDTDYAILGIGIALVMKIVSIIGVGGAVPYAVSSLFSNEIWFILGMNLYVFDFWKYISHKLVIGLIAGFSFLILSVLAVNVNNSMISFLLGLIACTAVIVICMTRNHQSFIMEILSRNTMPIFLMHSIFAATIRTVLLTVGISNAVINIVLGIIVSILGPMLVAWIMKKSKYLEFFIYPEKFIKIKSN